MNQRRRFRRGHVVLLARVLHLRQAQDRYGPDATTQGLRDACDRFHALALALALEHASEEKP